MKGCGGVEGVMREQEPTQEKNGRSSDHEMKGCWDEFQIHRRRLEIHKSLKLTLQRVYLGLHDDLSDKYDDRVRHDTRSNTPNRYNYHSHHAPSTFLIVLLSRSPTTLTSPSASIRLMTSLNSAASTRMLL